MGFAEGEIWIDSHESPLASEVSTRDDGRCSSADVADASVDMGHPDAVYRPVVYCESR